MNPGIAILLSLIIAAALVLGGFVVGSKSREENVRAATLERDVARRDLTALSIEVIELRASSDSWRQSTAKWRSHYVTLLAERQDSSVSAAVKSEIIQKVLDPPTVGEADRAAMAARRKRQEAAEMQPIGVRDKEVAPVPQLRRADDDH